MYIRNKVRMYNLIRPFEKQTSLLLKLQVDKGCTICAAFIVLSYI